MRGGSLENEVLTTKRVDVKVSLERETSCVERQILALANAMDFSDDRTLIDVVNPDHGSGWCRLVGSNERTRAPTSPPAVDVAVRGRSAASKPQAPVVT